MTSSAWVVGSRGGIGSACAAGLEADGMSVHRSDTPDEDVTRPGVAAAVAGRMARHGSIGAAVFAIGMSGRRFGDGPIRSCTDEGWHEVMRVNLTSAFAFLRACLNYCADGASVVLIGSALASRLDADFLTAAYRASKAALVALAEMAAFEGAAHRIRVNVVSPGLVDTPMSERARDSAAIQSRYPALMPLTQRPASAADVAAAVRWLVSDQSANTTGAVVPVDGGWNLH